VSALLGLLACVRPVPDHLRLTPDPAAEIDRTVTDARSAVALLARRDPLVRGPVAPTRESAAALTDAPWLLAWLEQTEALERTMADPDAALDVLERDWRGTPAVALARGQRLRLIETPRTPTADDRHEIDLARWLTPLRDDAADANLPRSPLDWLGPPERRAEDLRVTAERWVLTGWLDGPEIPVAALAPALASPLYDGLIQTPTGALLAARAAGANGDPAAGQADLWRATALALAQAAADRDGEQRAWSTQKRTAAEAIGDPDPIRAHLERARAVLTAAAGQPEAAGGALVAYAAQRLRNQCADAPCVALDRVATLDAAARWGGDGAAEIWSVIALKEAIDRMDVGADTVAFPSAMVDLVDALAGTGAGPLEADLVRVRRGDATTWNHLAASLGADGVTDWPGARRAIGDHLARLAESAIAKNRDPTLTPLLERIRDRANP